MNPGDRKYLCIFNPCMIYNTTPVSSALMQRRSGRLCEGTGHYRALLTCVMLSQSGCSACLINCRKGRSLLHWWSCGGFAMQEMRSHIINPDLDWGLTPFPLELYHFPNRNTAVSRSERYEGQAGDRLPGKHVKEHTWNNSNVAMEGPWCELCLVDYSWCFFERGWYSRGWDHPAGSWRSGLLELCVLQLYSNY